MRVTVCQLHHDDSDLKQDWPALAGHVRREKSDLVLLPELPFSPWFPVHPEYDAAEWNRAVDLHDTWINRLNELEPAVVLCTRPVNQGAKRFNEAFVYESSSCSPAHRKAYLPNEEGFWEAEWYHRGEVRFDAVRAGQALVGFAVCTEIWFFEHARDYARQGVQVLAHPRCTGWETLDKWLTGSRTASVVSGAFCLSSNRFHQGETPNLGGMGWITDPDGNVLGTTSRENPFLTLNLDLSAADRAKKTYPRYVET